MIKSSKSCKNHKEDKMSENSKKEPKLRFPGFTDAWEQRKLGEMAESFEYGLNAAATDYDGENKYLRITDIDDESHLFKTDSLTSPDTDLSTADNYKLQEGDVLFARTGASVGKTYRYTADDGLVYYAGFLIRARIKPEFDTEFVYQNTLTSKYDKYIKVTSQRSGQPGVNAQEYANFDLAVPELEEQKKIGDFFKSIDTLITLHQRKLSDVQNLKAGLLQKMFPKNGANVPEIRFPEFTNFWERRKFKDFIKKSGSKNKNGEDYPAYSVSNSLGLIPQNEQFEGSRLDNLDKSAYKFVKPNEFAYNPARINVGSIAFNDLGKTVIVSSLYVIMQMSKELDNEFALQYIKSPEFLKEVRRNTEGSVREYLFYENFKNVKLPYTPNIEEQKKIGNFFKQLDHLITLHQRKLEHLQEQKKSLLQQMFV